MKAIPPVVFALVIVVMGTIVQGIYSERWGRNRSNKLKEFSSRLVGVPLTVGDWEGTDKEANEEEFARSKCDAHVSRDYRNRRNGDVVSVYLVSGSGRHVTIHTPDWCYRGAGYDIDKTPIGYTIPVEKLEKDPNFRTATFTKHDVVGAPDRLRIFWAFTDSGQWQGPSNPKPVFGARDAMLKVYFITQAPLRNESPEESPTLEFAKEFLPEVNKVLFGATPDPNQESVASADGQTD